MRKLVLALALVGLGSNAAFAEDPEEDARTLGCLGLGRIRGAIYDTEQGALQPGLGDLLDGIARLHREKCPGKLILVLGHAYEMPTPALNEELSELRALTVRHELARRGIPLAKLVAVGLGDTLPLVPAETPDAIRLNRRVALRVLD